MVLEKECPIEMVGKYWRAGEEKAESVCRTNKLRPLKALLSGLCFMLMF